MYPELLKVNPINTNTLELFYDNSEVRYLDIAQYCQSNYFKQLLNWDYFCQVSVINGVPSWPNDHDIAPETVYLDSIAKDEFHYVA